jgi:SAM-dependent methyltransferase
LPFPGIIFDVITASGFVDYLPSFQELFELVSRKLRQGGTFLLSAINGHHLDSQRNPGHAAWQLHLPDNIAACLLGLFHELYIFPIEVINSKFDERENEILERADKSKMQVFKPSEVEKLAKSSDNIQQFVFVAHSIKSNAESDLSL